MASALARGGRNGRPVGVPHKLLGARLAQERGLGSFALAIAGHHGGLTSAAALKAELRSPAEAERSRQADATARLTHVLPGLVDNGPIQAPEAWHEALVREMAVRLCFSALCDADFLDTSAHFSGSAIPLAGPEADFGALRDRYEQSRKQLLVGRPESAVDAVREEIYRALRAGCRHDARGFPACGADWVGEDDLCRGLRVASCRSAWAAPCDRCGAIPDDYRAECASLP